MSDLEYRRLSCVECSSAFEQILSRGQPRKYCDPCRISVRLADSAERSRRNRDPAKDSERKKEAERAKHRAAGFVAKCAVCRAEFCPLYGSKYRAGGYCKPCADDVNRRRSNSDNPGRAKRFGVPRRYFDEISILERDGWRCQLCGVSTPKRLRGTQDDRAPEIDHIVPLSAGGGHLPENVQCACRKCNRRKSAKPKGQLMLHGFADFRVQTGRGRQVSGERGACTVPMPKFLRPQPNIRGS